MKKGKKWAESVNFPKLEVIDGIIIFFVNFFLGRLLFLLTRTYIRLLLFNVVLFFLGVHNI